MLLEMVKSLFKIKEEEYYPPIKELFSRTDIQAISIYLEDYHRNARDYSEIGILLHDLRLTGYRFPYQKREDEPRLMVNHIFENLFSRPNWRCYGDKNALALKMYNAAIALCKVLYCPEEDLSRYLGSMDTAVYAISCWRLGISG